MIDPKNPDYQNTPASDRRPTSWYQAAEEREPLFTVITPYFNAGPVFWETFHSLRRQSVPYWEWLIVDDESTDAVSLAQRVAAQELEPRIRVIRQKHDDSVAVCNRALIQARGKYVLFLSSGDMVEPTFVEKASWFLATQPESFGAVGSYHVALGAQPSLCEERSGRGVESRATYLMPKSTLLQVCQIGHNDTSAGTEDAAWTSWSSVWGIWAALSSYTIPEYLYWLHSLSRSSLTLPVSVSQLDSHRAEHESKWQGERHVQRDQQVAPVPPLAAQSSERQRAQDVEFERRFPRPQALPAGFVPLIERHTQVALINPLAKAPSITRVLLIVPWLEVGGADRFNLDMLRELSKWGYEFTVAATLRDDHPWLHEFTQLTPDVFCLHHFLNHADHPRFLSYLIESRQVDAVMVSNSAFGYALLPYLRARHPQVALLDYTHMEEPDVPNGGYPGASAQSGDLLDLRVTNTEHLRAWMIAHGAPAESIEVRRCGVDTSVWKRQGFDDTSIRAQFGVRPDKPLIAFVGRLVAQKRPLLFGEILARLAARGYDFDAVVVGDGAEAKRLALFVRRRKLEHRVRLLGTRSPQQVRELFAISDLLLLPSQQEGLAIVLMEAMSMGVIPVAADVGGQRELVSPESGILVPPVPPGADEVDAYVAALEGLLRSGDERRGAMAAAARTAVLRRYDLAQLGSELHQAFTRAIAQRSTSQDAQYAPNLEQAAAEADHILRALAHEDADDAAWRMGSDRYVVTLARKLREIYLPAGSRRFNAYRALRVSLRSSLPVSLLRPVRHP